MKLSPFKDSMMLHVETWRNPLTHTKLKKKKWKKYLLIPWPLHLDPAHPVEELGLGLVHCVRRRFNERNTWKHLSFETVYQQQNIFNYLRGVCARKHLWERERTEFLSKSVFNIWMILFLHKFVDWLLNLVLNKEKTHLHIYSVKMIIPNTFFFLHWVFLKTKDAGRQYLGQI